MKKVSRYQVCVIVVLVLFFSSLLITSEKHPKKGDIRSTEKTVVSWAKRAYQGFNLRMWLSNQSTVGIGAWDGDVPVDYVVNCGYGIGVSYPYTSCVEHVYGAGPIIGAKIDGVRYVTEGYNGNAGDSYFLPERKDTARDKFWFTSIDNWQSENRSGIDDDADGSIDEDELDGTDNDGDWNIALDDLGADNLADTNETGCKGVYDPLLNPDPAYDNYDATGVKRDTCHPNALGQFPKMNHKDLYTQGNGMPDHGESHVDEDYGALSQSDYYCSYTDTFKSPTYPNHKSMGIKVWQKSYAWKKGTAADAMIIHEYYVVNVGKKTLRDMYLGYFADMDIGPLSVAGYYQYNYSAFDASTKTAYTHNPVHNGSTPLGLTLLQAAKPFDSLQLMFQPHDFDPPCGGTSDSSLYDCLSCETFSGSCIAENESPHSLHDTRFTTSHGPYETMNPGDTVKMVYAFVSGESIREMLNNARRAERIWKSGGFIMPLVQVYDSGSGRPITLTWGSIARSPFGNVVSYKILYGTELGVYSDSIIVNDTTVTMNLPSGLVYNFVVRAIDEHGNESADSDEMNNIPQTPFHLSATGGDVSILIDWDDNPDADLLGYNIYRRSSAETTFVLLNIIPVSQSYYIDSDVWGDKSYTYKVSAVDNDYLESGFSIEETARLIPPAMPKNFSVGSGKDFIRLSWYPNQEGDLKEYRISRNGGSETHYLPKTETSFIDYAVSQGAVYYYSIFAIDSTDAVSDSFSRVGSPFSRAKSVTILNAWSKNINTEILSDSFFSFLFRRYVHIIKDGNFQPHTRLSQEEDNTTIFWIEDDVRSALPTSNIYLIALKEYILGSGNLIIIGRQLLTKRFNYWYDFLHEQFGIDVLTESDSNKTFAGAAGFQGFPSVQVDSVKLDSLGSRLNFVERFPFASNEQILYTYQSNPFDANAEGKPVGLRAKDTSFHAYYFSFPLYYIDTASAQAFIDKILAEIGEQPLSVKVDETIPEQFALLQNYPNPFNPSTVISYKLKVKSLVTIKVYDVLGKEVTTLVQEKLSAGNYEISWNARDVSSGVYYCRMVAVDETSNEPFIQTQKLLLAK